MASKITIIGASGEVGFRLVQRLSDSYKINCVVRDRNKRNFKGIKNVEVFEVKDIKLKDCLLDVFEGSNVIINAGYIWFMAGNSVGCNMISSWYEKNSTEKIHSFWILICTANSLSNERLGEV